MSQLSYLEHRFVQFMPEVLDDRVLYVSIEYCTASHNCCCGCGIEVSTPIDPSGWTLSFDGETVSLSPSIGNWQLACRSHYWICRNRVNWIPYYRPLDGERSNARVRWSGFGRVPSVWCTIRGFFSRLGDR